jgi:dTDP-4-dehydrorhamnose 3,5-epimerase
MSEIRLINAAVHRDERGWVQFVNAFTPSAADRFYVIHPANVGEVRGWIGHKRERKWFFPITGRFDVGVVSPDRWDTPDRNLAITRYQLDASAPLMLDVAPGNFAAIVAREPNSALAVFSTGSIATAKEDDFRLPPDYWKF